jgi:hypothetical protein
MTGGLGNFLQAAPILKHPLKQAQLTVGPGLGRIPASQTQSPAHITDRLAGPAETAGDFGIAQVLAVQGPKRLALLLAPGPQLLPPAAAGPGPGLKPGLPIFLVADRRHLRPKQTLVKTQVIFNFIKI